ncbi:sensor histidine kinase [Legionella sp. CNM-4043-24]|uniref:sensor histidine kinase n=1 Tax=Legionella sp. CNM-4043-24 TaxID=3421646 RepID=UPI00403AB175
MRQALSTCIQFILQALQRSLANAEHHAQEVGFIFFIGFPLSWYLWTECYPQTWESLPLSMAGCLSGLGLLLVPYWPARLKPYLPWYWFVSLMFCLSFFFAFFFLMSQASVISALSLLCSVFLLMLLLMDLPGLLIFLIPGWLLAFVVHYASSTFIYFGEEHVEMLIIISLVVIAATALNRKTTLLQQQRLAGMAAAAGMIAHELRTPLLGIKSGAQAMAQHTPQLLSAWLMARDQGLIEHPLRESRMRQVGEINQRIINESDYANTIIDMLLIKAGHDNALKNCHLETCSMADCLTETMARYPFKSQQQKNLVSWQGDFSFTGSKLLMQHILFNLLKNALYAIDAAQKGEISIWVASGERGNILYFRDTALGMSEKQVARLFNHFYTTTFMGTGLGLSFCKMVMHRFGGDIYCEAEEGRYTQFMLTFPEVG